ncbi:hypothetical protein AMTR_s00057p00185570 [Amborella trichopoda]|uniref:DNA polymerase zeta catalytic subunit n=2 Tax=Amborella trichopoda TaxID=13333 RepID=U5CUE8_AMBTC|nr:hypothetical protein AMTR_s00057p00185570 [Amborella trichopoda]
MLGVTILYKFPFSVAVRKTQIEMAKEPGSSNVFSVRIVSLDYYTAPPIPEVDICYNNFLGQEVAEVPVIRVYGSTLAGQKTCLHVHQVFPYLYIPYDDDLSQAPQEGLAYTRLLASAIEKALKFGGSVGSKRQHVHSCSLVRAKRFYGHYSSEELFIKIYLYYPHEVARVASLLLGGAILNRSFQPHESHIPFLLQFMVDYNLYGMGHLHLCKVKLRHPLPQMPTQRSNKYCDFLKLKSHEATSVSSTFEAEVGSSPLCTQPFIWISSTVPGSWLWPSPAAEQDSSTPGFQHIKRQSTCELEGDAIVHEILNQEHLLYTSLSQTRSEVRMVQSLVPIWEEEYARSGMHDTVGISDLSKPLPADVLKSLLPSLVFEDPLSNLYTRVQNPEISQGSPSRTDQKLEPCIQPSSELKEHLVDSCRSQAERLKDQDSKNSKDSILLPSPVGVGSSSLPVKDDTLDKVVFGDKDFPSSQLTGVQDSKVVDVEDLGLLQWLASSQALEDLSTDDELIHETILSPLLPNTALEKVLEKAHTDYESESQKECQDILDSVDIQKFEDLNQQALNSDCQNHSKTLRNTIPQIDGSSDDQPLHSRSGCPSKAPNESGTRRNAEGDSSAGVAGATKNHPKWCPLPFSPDGNVHEKLHSPCDQDNHTGSSSGSEAGKPCDPSLYSKYTKDLDFKPGRKLTECSMRDLMRRKRNSRSEPSELYNSRSFKRMVSGEGPNEEKFLSLAESVDAGNCNWANEKVVAKSPCLNQSIVIPEQSKDADTSHTKLGSNVTELYPVNHILPRYMPLPFSALGGSKRQVEDTREGLIGQSYGPVVPAKAAETDSLDCISGKTQEGCIDKADKFGSSFHIDVNAPLGKYVLPGKHGEEKSHEEFIVRTFNCKPPTVNCIKRQHRVNCDVPSLHCLDLDEMPDGISDDPLACSSVLPKDGKGHVDSLLPYFIVDVDGPKEVSRISNMDVDVFGVNRALDTIVGLPVYYQNDGSVLFLLTPALSPPSLAHVHHWLLQVKDQNVKVEDVGTSREKFTTVMEVLEATSPMNMTDLSLGKNNSHPNRLTASDAKEIPNACASHLECPHKSYSEMSPDTSKSSKPSHLPDQLSEEHHEKPLAQHVECQTNVNNMNLAFKEAHKKEKHVDIWQEVSQISGPSAKSKLTPLSQIGFRDPARFGAGQQLTLFSVEVLAESRGDLRPDPRYDPINVIVIVIQEDVDQGVQVHVILWDKHGKSCTRNLDKLSGGNLVVTTEEKDLFNYFMKLVYSFDPDIIMGWEVQSSSLGFLAERAANLGIPLLKHISRTPMVETKNLMGESEDLKSNTSDILLQDDFPTDAVVLEDAIISDEWGRTHTSGVHVGGRIVLNLWRIMRNELRLGMHTLEAVAEAVLRRKVPSFPWRILSSWFSSDCGGARSHCIEHLTDRAKLNLEIMDQLDMINRTAELARVFGIDFFSVLSRGSQYRVESMLLRLAHTQNYLVISPSKQQVALQPAMECLPLVMEPESGFCADPVVVLDFQSLYPSMLIAYNLCYCTCLGNVTPAKANVLGVSSFTPEASILSHLKDQILLTPNGVMYVPKKIRKGVLPCLLEEILLTRIMVKQAMKKLTTSQKVLHKIFNARQLALKLIANVTYGYTAAGFSGRMPCAEIADSIVQCGRRTLEEAICFVNAHKHWNARVVYGDTDSMFVLLKGRSREEAFEIGQEIASAITAQNPYPVTLKMEKVYHPCFLLTKKRYVGYSYGRPEQETPTFGAKGIETVRRDACPAVAKTLERSLRIFFETQDIFNVRLYLERQWIKILSGKVSLQDFIFCKEVRLGTYSSRASSLPPAAIVATKAMRADPRAEPHYGERVPYVVVHGEPGARLIDLVVDPLDILEIGSPYRVNDLYYINKQIIPALQRIFGLLGVDLRLWFSQMARPVRPTLAKRPGAFLDNENGVQTRAQTSRTRIDFYYASRHCALCGEVVQALADLCDKCSKKGAVVVAAMVGRTSKLEREIHHLSAICRHCGGGDWVVKSGEKCTSLSCPVFYERRKVQKEFQALSSVATQMGFYPRCMAEWF